MGDDVDIVPESKGVYERPESQGEEDKKEEEEESEEEDSDEEEDDDEKESLVINVYHSQYDVVREVAREY